MFFSLAFASSSKASICCLRSAISITFWIADSFSASVIFDCCISNICIASDANPKVSISFCSFSSNFANAFVLSSIFCVSLSLSVIARLIISCCSSIFLLNVATLSSLNSFLLFCLSKLLPNASISLFALAITSSNALISSFTCLIAIAFITASNSSNSSAKDFPFSSKSFSASDAANTFFIKTILIAAPTANIAPITAPFGPNKDAI